MNGSCHKDRRGQATITMTEAVELLSSDVLGRVKTPAVKREAILDEFERSGMTALAFAEHIGVKYPTFATWVQKRKKRRGDYPGRALSKAWESSFPRATGNAAASIFIETCGQQYPAARSKQSQQCSRPSTLRRIKKRHARRHLM